MAESGSHANLTYSGASERRKKIADLVDERGFASVSELTQILDVSEITVRRDLRLLGSDRVLRQVAGGASALASPQIGDFGLRSQRNVEAKRAIAQRAAAMVAPSALIALDAGTTTQEIARELPRDAPVTVVTNSLPVMSVLSSRPATQLMGVGGLFQTDTQAFTGPTALAALQQLRIELLFLAASSIHDGAIYCSSPLDAEMKRGLMACAERVVLVTDSSKLHLTALLLVAPLAEVDTVIVDDGLTDGERATLLDSGLTLVEVPLAPRTAAPVGGRAPRSHIVGQSS